MSEHTSSVYLDPLSRRKLMKTPTSEYESYFYLGVTVRARAPLPQTNCRFQQKTPFLHNYNTLCFNKERTPSAPITHLHINKLTNQQLRGLYWLTG